MQYSVKTTQPFSPSWSWFCHYRHNQRLTICFCPYLVFSYEYLVSLTFICLVLLSGFADNGCVKTLIYPCYLQLIISQWNVTAQFTAIKTNVDVLLNMDRLTLTDTQFAMPSVFSVRLGIIFVIQTGLKAIVNYLYCVKCHLSIHDRMSWTKARCHGNITGQWSRLKRVHLWREW